MTNFRSEDKPQAAKSLSKKSHSTARPQSLLTKGSSQIGSKKKAKAKRVTQRKKHGGITLIEVMIVVTLLAILILIASFSYRKQASRARDAKRKEQLQKLKIAFENYYNDNDCYPAAGLMHHCGAVDLQPYLNEVPCDPLTNKPYLYFGLNDNYCKGYRILIQLENKDDKDVVTLGCDPQNGCGWSDASYNYGMSVGAPISDTSWTGVEDPNAPTSPPATTAPQPTAIPQASPTPRYRYYCGINTARPTGSPWVYSCNSYSEEVAAAKGCTMSFDVNSDCEAYCLGRTVPPTPSPGLPGTCQSQNYVH